MTRIDDGLRNALGTVRAQLVHYGTASLLVLYAGILMLSKPVAAEGICDIPGASGALSLFFGVMVSIIAAICIFKFGGSIVKAIVGGPGSNAKLRITLIVVGVGLFVALGMDTLLPWFMKQIGGSPASVDVGCMIPGSGGG